MVGKLTPLEKAGILVEALPYIKKFYGQTVVIKYGGSAMINDELKQAIITDVVLMKFVGMHPVLVHGGGAAIDSLLEAIGKKSTFIEGLRVTDQETMDIAEMVLAGKVNKEIVSLINREGGKAVGFSGKDGNLIEAEKKIYSSSGSLVDFGFVGDVRKINPEVVENAIKQGYIPVVAPIGAGIDGHSYNINADYAASALAAALKSPKFVLLTDVEGIMRDQNDPGSLISFLHLSEVRQLIEEGVIAGGMIPKVLCCVQAIREGVGRTHIIDGRIPHSILLEVFTDKGIGTMVVDDKIGGKA